MTLFNLPYATLFDTDGVLEPGAKAYFYQAGTTTPLDTYSDASLTTANTNPVVADGGGILGPIYLKAQPYKVVIKDASDSTIKTVDNYFPIQSGEQILYAGTVGGTADAVLLTTAPLLQSLRDGTRIWFRAASANTAAMTVNLDGLGVKSLTWPDGTAMEAGDVDADAIVEMAYDADNDVFNLISVTAPPLYRTGGTLSGPLNEAEGAAIASAATINLDTATGNFVHITGTTTITAVTLAQGAERTVVFDDALTLTNGASLLLGGADIVTVAGDVAVFRGEGSSVTRLMNYMRADQRQVQDASASQKGAVQIGDGLFASAGVASALVIQHVAATPYTANAALSTNIPIDDSVPVSTEGTEILTAAITPATNTNKVLVAATGTLTVGTGSANACVALFRGTTCIYAMPIGVSTTSANWHLVFEDSPESTSAQTYSIRVGAAAVNVFANGTSAARLFGGVAACTMELLELRAT